MAPTNVLLVTIDCLRQDRCGFAGHHRDTTPGLDALATESVVFRNAQAPGPRTAESVPGILGGRLSADCAYLEEPSYKAIPGDAETLGTWLRGHGYETVAVISNPQLSPVRNFDRGFEHFENLRIDEEGDRFESLAEDDGRTGQRRFSAIGRRALSFGETAPVNPTALASVLYRYAQLYRGWPTVDGARVVSELTTRLSEAQTPFFAWAHLNDLHAPLHPERVRAGGVDAGNLEQFLSDSRRVRHRTDSRYGRMYDGALRYVDTQLQRLCDSLRDIGEYENTLLVVTADHGEALGDRGIYGHAAGSEQRLYDADRDYLYRELLNVPLILRKPSKETATIQSPVSLTWLHQMIADALGIPCGDFPESPGSAYGGDVTVFADSLTDRGHTLAAISGREKVITDGTVPGKIEPGNWFYLDTVDAGERTWSEGVDPDSDLVAEVAGKVVSPTSLRRLQGSHSGSTLDQLAALGYQ